MSSIGRPTWNRNQEKTAEKFAEGRWPVYAARLYQLHGIEGHRHIQVAKPAGTALWMEAEERSVSPLASEYRDLFLRFANLFDSQQMDSGLERYPGCSPTLDTPRNAEVALAWAREYGVLGLGTNPGRSSAVGGGLESSSEEIAAKLLGVPHLGHSGTRAYRKSAEGGKHETVETFVLKAREADVVLKLYTAATAKTPNILAIERFMSDDKPAYAYPPGSSPSYARYTERETWAEDAESARDWALMVVEQAVARHVEKDVYPILLGERGSYEEGWGFKSLLGAMWLQMRMFMLGDKTYDRCVHCGDPFYKRRRDQTYCSEACGSKARAARSYERKKQRQQEARTATSRRLRGLTPP